MTLEKNRRELARDHDLPERSSKHGYEFVAPVSAEVLYDPDEWKAISANAGQRAFGAMKTRNAAISSENPTAIGLSLTISTAMRSGSRFGRHHFALGECVSVRKQDDRLRTFSRGQFEDVVCRAA